MDLENNQSIIGNGDLFLTVPELFEIIPNLKTAGLAVFTEDYKETFFDHQKKKTLDYENKIGRREIFGLSFTLHEMLKTDEVGLRALQEAIAGRVVIDLGAGDTPWGYYLACSGGAKAYVAVEHYHADKLTDQLFHHAQSDYFDEQAISPEVKRIPYSVVAEDALTFLKRLPNDSVSLFAFGIGYDVLSDKDYALACGVEVVRVLSVGGVLVESKSPAITENMPPERLKIVYESVISVIRYI